MDETPSARTAADPHVITIDTREQLPYAFERVRKPVVAFRVERETLPEGDYGVRCGTAVGVPWKQLTGEQRRLCCVVERKSLSDFQGTATRGRRRFERELRRLARYGYAALVVEGQLSDILNTSGEATRPSGLRPKSAVASLIAWGQRHGVQTWLCPGRAVAEIVTYRILERWIRDEQIRTQNAG